jgi:hypothetical protein
MRTQGVGGDISPLDPQAELLMSPVEERQTVEERKSRRRKGVERKVLGSNKCKRRN